MKILSLLLLILVIPAFSPYIQAVSAGIEELNKENQSLTSELALAKMSSLYFIFDIQDRKIYFRYRGETLKEINIHQVKIWGQLPHGERLSLARKNTFFEPQRSTVDPKKREKDGAVEIDALELKDMPSSFILVLDDETALYIRQNPRGFFSNIALFSNSAANLLSRPICSIWRSLSDKQCNSVSLIMSREDAQSLYWSFSEGMELIISSPIR